MGSSSAGAEHEPLKKKACGWIVASGLENSEDKEIMNEDQRTKSLNV